MARIGVHLRFDELVIEVVAFTGALADAGEHRIAAVRLGDIVDELLNDHGFANAGAAEQPDLAASSIGRQQIDHLDSGHQDLRLGRLFGEARRRLMDRAGFGAFDRTGLIDRLADHIHDAAERAGADRNSDRPAGIGYFLTTHQAVAGIHRHGAHRGLAELLGDLEHQAVTLVFRFQRIEDRGQMVLEMHVDDRAGDLSDASDGLSHSSFLLQWEGCNHSASAPEMISINSLVIIAWRVRL